MIIQIHSCDLLEKSYFCCIANNWPVILNTLKTVVICLKNRTFAVLQTTQACVKAGVKEL